MNQILVPLWKLVVFWSTFDHFDPFWTENVQNCCNFGTRLSLRIFLHISYRVLYFYHGTIRSECSILRKQQLIYWWQLSLAKTLHTAQCTVCGPRFIEFHQLQLELMELWGNKIENIFSYIFELYYIHSHVSFGTIVIYSMRFDSVHNSLYLID